MDIPVFLRQPTKIWVIVIIIINNKHSSINVPNDTNELSHNKSLISSLSIINHNYHNDDESFSRRDIAYSIEHKTGNISSDFINNNKYTLCLCKSPIPKNIEAIDYHRIICRYSSMSLLTIYLFILQKFLIHFLYFFVFHFVITQFVAVWIVMAYLKIVKSWYLIRDQRVTESFGIKG